MRRIEVRLIHLGAFAVVIVKSPLAHGGIGKSTAFQVLHGVTMFSLLVGGFLLFPVLALAVTFFGVAVTSEKVFPLGEVYDATLYSGSFRTFPRFPAVYNARKSKGR